MRLFFRENKFLIIALCIFTLVSGVSIGNRFAIEQNNKTYDIVADYNEINLMADQTHKAVSYWLKQFRDQLNITKIGVLEESISSLMEDDSNMHVSGKVMDQVMQEANWEKDYPQAFIDALDKHGYDKYDVLIKMGTQEAVDFVLPAIQQRFEKDKYFTIELNGEAYAVIDGNSKNALYKEPYKLMDSRKGGFSQKTEVIGSKIMYISLGLLPEKVATVQNLGMEVVPRTLCYDGFNGDKYAKAVVAGYKQYGIVPEYLIAGGDSVIGHDDGIQFAEKYINENHIKLGLIENTTQLQNILQYGVEDIAKDNDYNAVRVFSVWDYIQYRYQFYGYEGAKEIENTLFRSVTERNIRVIYYKPIKENKDLFTYVTDMGEYKEMFQNLEKRLANEGFTYGSASTMKNYEVSTVLKLLMSFGCVAGTLLLLRAFTPIRRRETLVLGGLGVLGALAASYVIPNTFEILLSFSAAVIFACLAVTLFTRLSKEFSNRLKPDTPLLKIVQLAGLTLIACVLVAMMGAMMTAAPISSTKYMLEIDVFRGVKLAQLLPIAYFGVIYLAYYGYNSSKKTATTLEVRDIRELLNTTIKVWMLILGAIMAGVGYYYIARTGHETAVEVSSIEMLFRNYLEDTLIARPRNKEFLFAFPAIMMMVYSSVRKYPLWPVIFGLAGVIGMTSVVNTFMHIRTPLYLGFARTGYSLVFGLVVGIVGILVFEGIHHFYIKRWVPFIQSYAKKEEAGN
ncbi:DUF5693 family protein [Clostridium aminobutyricum]|uniref:Uncharacterized protein n=1 Tax=Clostridium aminobutyricum TaxID=33953 RepID=A0A939D7Z7_CLOAM|nr:DUF5693 family protein [Clostridium aminobutyricum]MBN7772892.1 hypothetical protein [Clostridium aminobutyricum]